MTNCDLPVDPGSACKAGEAVDQEIEVSPEQRRISNRNSIHDPFILRLPFELASRVFVFCVPSEDEQVAHRGNCRTQLLLTWVCKGELAHDVQFTNY